MNRRKTAALSVSIWAALAAFVLLLCLFDSLPTEAATCDVPSGSHATIQSAVDDSACDTVNLIGALYEEYVVITRNVTISGQGPTQTVVDGGGSNSVFRVRDSSIVTLTDMTITNGRANDVYGGGIDVGGESGLTLMNTIVKGNWADDGGGGLYTGSLATTIIDSQFIGNFCLNFSCSGGAIYHEGGPLTIKNSTFISNTAGSGAAIYNGFRLTITKSTFFFNTARHAGGVLANRVYANIVDSWFADNQADLGGVINNTPLGEVYINRSTLSDNLATDQGGAIWNVDFLDSPGIVEIVNSTLSGNSAGNEGGAIFNYENSDINIINSTLAGNMATNGGATYNMTATINITNTIVANSLSGGDCGGAPVTSFGNNIDSDGSCGLNEPSDLPDTNPLLGPLEDYGGQTPTHALLPLSPAIDAGNNSGCPATDQRGVSRPFDGDGDLDPICDIGAFELDLLFDEHIFLPSIMKHGS